MIVECESCKNKFKLDENLLKNTGTKVRCSICKNVFTVYLPEEKLGIEEVSLGDEEKEVREEREDSDFDKIFSQKIEEEIAQEQGEVEPISIDDLPDLGQDYQEQIDAKKIDSDREAATSDMAEEEGLVQEEVEEREVLGEEEGLIRHHEIIKKRRRPG